MFHVTNIYLGEYVLLKPYIPGNPMEGEETDTPRICVAPNVLQCLTGKTGRVGFEGTLFSDGTSAFVYRTNCENYIVANTPDQAQHNEHWYLNPTMFKYVGTIRMDSNGVIQVETEVELHRKLMVAHHINRFNGLINRSQLMDHWREEAMIALDNELNPT